MSPFTSGGLIHLNRRQRRSFKKKSGRPRSCFNGKTSKFKMSMEEAAVSVFPAELILYLCNECGFIHAGHPLKVYEWLHNEPK